MTTGVFKFFAQAVASLKSDGWTMASGDINTYVRGPAKARVKPTLGGYKIVYSKKRNK